MIFVWVIAWTSNIRQVSAEICATTYNLTSGLKTIYMDCGNKVCCNTALCCDEVTTAPVYSTDMPFYMTWYFWTIIIVIILLLTGIMGAYTRYLAHKRSKVSTSNTLAVSSISRGYQASLGYNSSYFMQNAACPPSYEEATLASIKWKQTHLGVDPWFDAGANRPWHSLIKPMMPAYKTGFISLPNESTTVTLVPPSAASPSPSLPLSPQPEPCVPSPPATSTTRRAMPKLSVGGTPAPTAEELRAARTPSTISTEAILVTTQRQQQTPTRSGETVREKSQLDQQQRRERLRRNIVAQRMSENNSSTAELTSVDG